MTQPVADQTVIVAVDHSIQAEDAVKYYLDKMHRRGNKLMLVHCVELPEMNRNVARDCNISPAVLAGMWKEEEAKSRGLEDKMKQLLTNRGVSAKLRSCSGRPGEMICRIADEMEAAYIVTGTASGGARRHPSGGATRGGGVTGGASLLTQSLLGGVSDYLLRHARCPVVVCLDAEAIRRRRHASDGKNRRRHASAKDVKSGGGGGGETFASSWRRRFLSGGKESASMDSGRHAGGGGGAMLQTAASFDTVGLLEREGGEGGGAVSPPGGEASGAERVVGVGESVATADLPIMFHTKVQLYPMATEGDAALGGGEAHCVTMEI